MNNAMMPPMRPDRAKSRSGTATLLRLAAAAAIALAFAFAAAAALAGTVMGLLGAEARLAAALAALAILVLGDVRHDDLLGLGC
jgi:hypothetical protein